MGPVLVQKQALKQKLSPALFQSVTLLQFSNTELSDYIKEKALENPLLRAEPASFHGRRDEWTESVASFGDRSKSATEVIEETVGASTGFRERLHNDLRQLSLDKTCMKAADLLIDSLNDNGYIEGSPEKLLADFDMERGMVARALNAVQSLDPAGVGARSLSECLLLQLKRLCPRRLLAETIITEFSNYFLTENWQSLSDILEEPEERIREAVACIRGLHPFPITADTEEKTEYIIPDIIVRKIDSGLSCELEDRYLPAITIETQDYEQYMYQADQQTKRYLRKKKSEAEWLLANISRRKRTLIRLAELLIEAQNGYFVTGDEDSLRPFTMKKAAGALALDESTVSRAAANKYIQTPYGLFPMKKFFVRPVGTGWMNVSALQIQSRIKYWIGREDRRKPLSDQQLVQMLSTEGLRCSRRAVAKYRKECGIASTIRRRTR